MIEQKTAASASQQRNWTWHGAVAGGAEGETPRPPAAFVRAGTQRPDHAHAAAALLAGKPAAAVTGGLVGGWSGLKIGPRFTSSPAPHQALARSPTEARGNRRKGEERSRLERKQTSRAWASLSRPRIRIGIPPVFSSSFALESASRATCRSESDRGNRYLIEHPGRGTSSDGETTMEFNASLYFFWQ